MFKLTLSSNRRSIIVRNMPESKTFKGIHSKPILVNIDEAKDIPLCINCKYYNPHSNKLVTEARLGECRKYGEMNVIDGSIIYKNTETARQYFCHGDMFEHKILIDKDPESYKDFLK